jgi:dipeptidyl aminopeptidase/acylaminoacyl peptidase
MPLPVAASLHLLTLIGLCAAAAAAIAQAPSARVPIESFFANPKLDAPVLSPNARYVALREAETGQRDSLAVIDVATNTMKSIAAFGNGDVGRFQWVNDTRLVFDTHDSQLAQGDREYAPGLYAVDRDGQNFVQLVDRSGEGGRIETGSMIKTSKQLPWHTFILNQVGRQDSDWIYVRSNSYDSHREVSNVKLIHLNTRTQQTANLIGPAGTRYFILDHNGEPRLAVTYEGELQAIHHRERATGNWRKLASFASYKAQAGSFSPLAFGPDGTLYVEATAGKDKASVHTYNLASGKLSDEPVVETQGYDFTGHLVISNGKVLGLQVTTDAESNVWIDPAMQAIQKEVDSKLTGTVNLISVAARPELPVVLVTAYSDVQPRAFLLYNTEKKTFTRIGATYPAIKPEQMGRQKPVRYKARDGLDIPALLTMPPGAIKDKLPLVVVVHGGPYMRGNAWGWEPDSQFLATRGYAVLEPDFRGSTGYGNAHFRAGWKQWGKAMQDDIADGVKWAVAQGIADPARVCIAGASYGGYSALMGLINDPGVYKCGINWAGVTDIGLLYSGSWGFMSNVTARYRRYGMPELLGDPVKDAAQFEATSPLLQAARVTQPLLLAYGGADERVPIYHGKKFHAAVKKTNPNVEWIEYRTEGHGWALPENRVDFWTRVEKFLDRHIGKP